MIRNNFDTLSKNRNDFITRLALDDEIAKLMINGNKKYKDNTVNDTEKYGLIGSQVYPFPKVMEGVTETKSYITMKFRYRKLPKSNYFKAAQVTIYCFCHNSLAFTAYQTLRYDEMLSAVDRLINNTEGEAWIGKMELEDMTDVIIDTQGTYVGIAVTYRNVEFQ